MTSMNPKIKKMWCKALRSGNYKQGTGRLRRKHGDTYYYCCLGVLSVLYCKAHASSWRMAGRKQGLSRKVATWAGLPKGLKGPTDVSIRIRSSFSLSGANDQGATFTMIADAIETQL